MMQKNPNNARQPAEKGERRCLVTGAPAEREDLIRFALGPDNRVYPDLNEKLGGRGIWITPSKKMVQQAVDKKLFAKGFEHKNVETDGLVELTEKLLKEHSLKNLSLANKAGVVIAGFEKVAHAAKNEPIALLVEANDAATEGRDKLKRLLPDAFVCNDFTSDELGQEMGRDFCVHIGMKTGKMARNFKGGVLKYRRFINEEEVK